MKIDKKTINRSFSIVKQIRQFEPRNFFASYGREGEWTDKEEQELSKKLYLKAKEDCENALEEYLEVANAIPKTTEERIKNGEKVSKEEIINEAKKKDLPF